jgi:hypothetical protein
VRSYGDSSQSKFESSRSTADTYAVGLYIDIFVRAERGGGCVESHAARIGKIRSSVYRGRSATYLSASGHAYTYWRTGFTKLTLNLASRTPTCLPT